MAQLLLKHLRTNSAPVSSWRVSRLWILYWGVYSVEQQAYNEIGKEYSKPLRSVDAMATRTGMAVRRSNDCRRHRTEVHALLTQIEWLTDFGDQAVVLPLASTVALFLMASRWWRGAGTWMLAVGGVLGTMLTLKLVFGACGWEVSTGLNSPSGHTASAAALYGGLGSIVIQRLGVVGTGLLALVIAVLFGMTRVMLGDHTVPEAIVGGTVGVIGAITLRSLMGHPPTRLRRGGLVMLVVVVASVTHGRHLAVEQQIRTLSSVRLPTVLCPR